jgi:molecular chaperone GrpE
MKKTDEKVDDTKWVKKIEEIEKERDEWKAKCMRALADYQNLERRNREEREEIRKFAGEIVIVKMLSAIDTLKKAKDHLKDAGLDLAYKEFKDVLLGQGMEEIKTVGEDFNPHEMECIEVVGGEENKVIEEVRAGYRLYGKVLRVAQVKVGKNINSV